MWQSNSEQFRAFKNDNIKRLFPSFFLQKQKTEFVLTKSIFGWQKLVYIDGKSYFALMTQNSLL